ncbi:hypothetical protein GCM10020255_086450 [Rhodococcus baikonurensis]
MTELDWADYRSRYGDIGRLDLILEAEGDSPIHYKASKQADILMLLYVFTAEELTELITRLGYEFDPSVIPEMIDYYLERTTHGSTLSRISHTWVLLRGNRSQSWAMLRDALAADLSDARSGSTRKESISARWRARSIFSNAATQGSISGTIFCGCIRNYPSSCVNLPSRSITVATVFESSAHMRL